MLRIFVFDALTPTGKQSEDYAKSTAKSSISVAISEKKEGDVGEGPSRFLGLSGAQRISLGGLPPCFIYGK